MHDMVATKAPGVPGCRPMVELIICGEGPAFPTLEPGEKQPYRSEAAILVAQEMKEGVPELVCNYKNLVCLCSPTCRGAPKNVFVDVRSNIVDLPPPEYPYNEINLTLLTSRQARVLGGVRPSPRLPVCGCGIDGYSEDLL